MSTLKLINVDNTVTELTDYNVNVLTDTGTYQNINAIKLIDVNGIESYFYQKPFTVKYIINGVESIESNKCDPLSGGVLIQYNASIAPVASHSSSSEQGSQIIQSETEYYYSGYGWLNYTIPNAYLENVRSRDLIEYYFNTYN
jgi:hypothetical protein